MSSSYHHETDGQSEVTNRYLERSIGMSPFMTLYGRPPPVVPRYELGQSVVHEVDQTLVTRDEISQEQKLHLSRVANQMKQTADLKRRDVEFQFVYRRASQKLASRYYGPFPVEERIGKLAYKLQLPAGSKIHAVFHVLLFKKHIGDDVPVSIDLPPLSIDGDTVLEPKEESLVPWKHLPHEDATWENSAELQSRFPALNLEDKVPLKGGSNDRSPRRSARVPIKNKKYLD
ncbi:uncharacterized protein LOC105629787 [Jatropha curcas]|uniref:uncharacterized protein LOC105629787 n=1 Tax=Jatropha curcas TaxID=180498 RepID=UPI001893197A|nr:uncharacterized protein LOC105629787 [Jatropha curcas]